ncbi:hypothetical protein EDD18DRAFT_1361014 [Armillaria luteobubalina]|uniref:Uncharacterized protein n=1 Tax=Armillaria luteobubalina TaxID=153913 RepID=A0AA39UDT5_9AGAR|nr:hypothetical protein EDD18DRAFT_1361014 [Armillaria luteobubalina]
MSTSSFALCQPLTPGPTLSFGSSILWGRLHVWRSEWRTRQKLYIDKTVARWRIMKRPDGAPRSDLVPSTSALRFLSLVERAPILPAVAILDLAWPLATFELRPEGSSDRHRHRQASLFGFGSVSSPHLVAEGMELPVQRD